MRSLVGNISGFLFVWWDWVKKFCNTSKGMIFICAFIAAFVVAFVVVAAVIVYYCCGGGSFIATIAAHCYNDYRCDNEFFSPADELVFGSSGITTGITSLFDIPFIMLLLLLWLLLLLLMLLLLVLEKNWGFLAKFDSKGMLKTEKELPDKLNMFSNTLPNTSSGSYGAKLESPVGRQILNLEFKFYGNLRRKRTEDLLCC
ncbi:Hypothetical predicted protein [Octopus vulgaris]|uniref:Uncharacterized protein n=1 Tax=Octopus vulgaris TaxID=6645 RepID=A0AA36F949_OCTVU|nr:Hypothetical predicted protein [Octopus vulgaris]